MRKEIDVIEQPVSINMVVQPVDTEVQEPVLDVEVQVVDDKDIEVEDVHIVDIEMSEAFPFMTNGALNESMDDKDVLLDGGVAVDKNDEYVLLQDLLEISAGSGTVSHPDLHGRELSNQHPISAIDKLQENLDALGATERVYSSSNGLGEFRQWKDGNPEGEDRSGYFVAIVPGTDEIEICDATHDVYGISVHHSGFIGNQDDLYYKGKDLLNNNANDPSYAVVGIVGAMRVRTDGTARNGDYVVPNAYGEATLSENDYGYKVLSQGSYPSYNYVTIAITPQSDALSRLQSSVTSGDLGEILIKIENIENSVGDLEVKVDASTEDIEDILGEIGGLQQRVVTAEEVVKDAVEQAEEAKDVATQAASKAAQAQQDAQDAAAGAISSANKALSDVSNLAEQMEPIVSWQSEDGVYSGAGGFVNQANEDHTILSSIVSGSGPDGSNLAAIIQKVDENGAIIQHLVSHVDRYVVGENSLSDGLTHDEAKSILTEEYVYVPTYDHDETMTGEPNVVTNFKRGYYYVWDVISGVWVESTTQVSMATAYNDGSAEGDLWYCWQDVVVEYDTYIAGTLYRWFGDEWVAVATTADNRNARILTSIRQEADSIHMDVVNLQGDVSSIEQNVDSITTRVGTAEGNISSITQEVSDIQSNISTIDGTVSSLQQHADDTDASLTAIALGRFPTAYNTFIDTVPPTPYDGKRYTHPPVWDDAKQEFVFNEAYASSDGAYYFHSDDKTKYCHVTNNGYDLCTISKEVTAMLDNRIDENAASIDALVTFKNNTTTSLANISAQVDTNKSNITSLTTKVNNNSSSLAAVSQKADNNSASIGLVVQRVDGVIDGNGNLTDESISSKGSIIIQAINGESSAQINADRIKLTATDSITLAVSNAKKEAIQQANSDTDGKLKNYSTTTQMNAAITQKADSITSSVAATYATKDALGNYATTAKVSQIEQKVNANSSSIGLVVQDGKASGKLMMEAINNDTSSVTISANKIKLEGTDSISIAVSNAVTQANNATDNKLKNYATTSAITPASIVASINDSGSEVIINANKINLSGYVTISDLSTAGKTTINGSNITTGALQSANYSYTSGTYSTAGTKIDLTNGAITSKNFAIDANGIIYANAANLTYASIEYASLLSCVINNMLIIAGTSNQPISYLTNGSILGIPLLNVNQGQFTIASDGFVTVKNGLNLISVGSSSTTRTALAFTVPSPYDANQYVQLSHIDAYYNTSNSRYETRWITDSSDVIKIHSQLGGLSIDAGPNQQLHIGTTTDNNGFGQLVYINSQQINSTTTILGTNITIGAYGTDRIDLVGSVYLNGTLLTSGGSGGGVAVFG